MFKYHVMTHRSPASRTKSRVIIRAKNRCTAEKSAHHAAMKTPALSVWLCLMLLAAMPPCHADTVSLESFLLSPSPDLTLTLKGDLESEVSLLLGKYPGADQAFIKSKIVLTEAAKKALTTFDVPLVTSKSNPLAVSLQHLLELYICKQHVHEGRLHIETINEGKGEFETREYYTSPALLAAVLGKDAGKEPPGKIPWVKFEDRLKPFRLRIVGLGEHDERVLLEGETSAHVRFNAELTLLLIKTLHADIESRITRPEKPPVK
jgi:hypothetical protein